MKKILGFGVLLILLTSAVFAQDSGSGWKIGFRAQLTKDFFYSTKASGEFETAVKTSPSSPLEGTSTTKLGDYIKGSSNLFTYTDGKRPDNRLIVSLSNDGNHHSVYVDLKLDNDDWLNGFTFMKLLEGDAADWCFAGDTGGIEGSKVVFDGKVGTGRYGGFVPVYEIWDDYVQDGHFNFFGVQKTDGFLASNNISATSMSYNNPWDAVYALGATFGGNFRIAIGSTLGSFSKGFDDPLASASSVEAGFMISSKNIADLLSFDLFYAINGEDRNTVMRGTGKWENILGVYAGIDMEKLGVKGLGLSVGYTANFTADEKGQRLDTTDIANPKWVPTDITNPVWSGIDINVKFSGIEKIGITFANNISFASVTGDTKDNLTIMGLSGTTLPKDYNENWFAYKASLAVSYSVSDRLSITLALRNLLGVFSTDIKQSTGTAPSPITTITVTSAGTEDNLYASLHADYNVGNVSFGIGLNLGILGVSVDAEGTTSISGGGINTSSTTTVKGNLNNVTFSVPLFFKVAI